GARAEWARRDDDGWVAEAPVVRRAPQKEAPARPVAGADKPEGRGRAAVRPPVERDRCRHRATARLRIPRGAGRGRPVVERLQADRVGVGGEPDGGDLPWGIAPPAEAEINTLDPDDRRVD